MILHDAIKTIKNKVFPFSLKNNKILFLFKKTKKLELKKKKKTQVFFFFFKPGFFSTLTSTAWTLHYIDGCTKVKLMYLEIK